MLCPNRLRERDTLRWLQEEGADGMCSQPEGRRGLLHTEERGQIWNVVDKLAALCTLLSAQIFCITGGGSFLVRALPAELKMFFHTGMANRII